MLGTALAAESVLARFPEVWERQWRAEEREATEEQCRGAARLCRRGRHIPVRCSRHLERASALQMTLCRVGHRRASCKRAAYLGECAGSAFPVIKQRIRKLQQAGKRHEAQALAYAVEAEMAARRVARESRFPKTGSGQSRRSQGSAPGRAEASVPKSVRPPSLRTPCRVA